jgi:hypothetical protein
MFGQRASNSATGGDGSALSLRSSSTRTGAAARPQRATTERSFVSSTQREPEPRHWDSTSQQRVGSSTPVGNARRPHTARDGSSDFRPQRSGFFSSKTDLSGERGVPFSSSRGGIGGVSPGYPGVRVSGRPARRYDRRLGCSPSPHDERTSVTALEGPFLDERLGPDTLVQLQGLKANAQHNGKHGHIKGHAEEGTPQAGRYIVKLSSGESLALKPENVVLLAYAHEAWRFKSLQAIERLATPSPIKQLTPMEGGRVGPLASPEGAEGSIEAEGFGGMFAACPAPASPEPAPAPTPEPEPEPAQPAAPEQEAEKPGQAESVEEGDAGDGIAQAVSVCRSWVKTLPVAISAGHIEAELCSTSLLLRLL